jgi:hypothetical protein
VRMVRLYPAGIDADELAKGHIYRREIARFDQSFIDEIIAGNVRGE